MNENDQTTEMKALSDEVLRKIGRNVLLFQQIESLLKFLVVNHRVESTASGPVGHQQKRVDRLHKRMMGNLVEMYNDGILSDAGVPEKEPEDVSQVRISTTFSISADSEFYEAMRVEMQQMVNERNDLIHHFLPRWDSESVEKMNAAAAYLDQQRVKVLPILEHLQAVAKSMKQSRSELVAFLSSDEGNRQLELIWLQQSPLVILLQDVASQRVRPDGWTYLALAGHLARFHEPEAVSNIKERYGHSTLKQLLYAAEIFDVYDEPLPNGGFRTLYRAKNVLTH